MRFLLLEDDPGYAELIQGALREHFPHAEIDRISNEWEFRQALPTLATASFDAAIFDIMVHWCNLEQLDGEAGENVPEEVGEEAEGLRKWRAGLRCRRLLRDARAAAKAPALPLLFYSVLDWKDLQGELEPDAVLVLKNGDLQALVQNVRQLIHSRL